MKSSAQKWLELAEKDIQAAEILSQEAHLTNIVLFHSQQCVEKSLKASLVYFGLEVPRIHNIKRLHTIFVEQTEFSSILTEDEIDFLDSIYIDSRYPTELGILPSGYPDLEVAHQALQIARKVLTEIRRQLQ